MYEQNTPGQTPGQNGILRGAPEAPENEKALAEEILKSVKEDEKKWETSFKRMRADMKFVRMQLPSEKIDDERAKVNVTQRHIKQRVAQLYAKDPTFVAKRKARLDFAMWDGKQSTLQKAAAEMQAGMVSPETQMLLQDVQETLKRRSMLDGVGKTLEVLLRNALDEQQPPFKSQAKQLVRRAVVCSVGYVKVGYQRQLEKRPDTEYRLPDLTPRVAQAEVLMADQADQKFEPESARAAELEVVTTALQADQDRIVREGLVYDYPSPLRIIPDRNCTLLAPGFPGSRRVSEYFMLTPDQIKAIYSVDIGDKYTCFSEARTGGFQERSSNDSKSMAKVWEVYDKVDGVVYTLCEGYEGFLEPPKAPPLPYLETFFPWLPLVLNALEEEGEIFPESDVRLMRPIQREINRKAEAIRQARIASRPLYLAKKGALSEDDQNLLANHEAHDVVELEGVDASTAVDKIFQPFPKVGVDPNLYETGTDVTFLGLIVGASEAQLGATNSDSATANSISENNRLEGTASDIDELDDFLSLLARVSSQVLLRESSPETVKRVVGPGAVWPDLNPEEVAEEIYLDVEAGSSGRPNKARDLANFERAAPFLLQVPGITPEWLAKFVLNLLDSRIDLDEALTYGLPSITTMNRSTQPGTGDPATDPNAQGAEGGDNAQKDQQGSPGGPGAGAGPAPTTEQPNVALPGM